MVLAAVVLVDYVRNPGRLVRSGLVLERSDVVYGTCLRRPIALRLL